MTRAGRYELVRPLARGGMAEVYLARRRAAGVEKWLVVKRIRPERANDARFLELFVREARLSMSLAHQNIVPVFDFGRSADQVFIAMERVEGKDLGSTLARAGKPLPPLLAAFVAAECCQALDYAHHRKGPDGSALGIVHRDVTPRNVLLSWAGEVKLTDFGIASLAGDPEAAERTIGTPAYMAPEQARAAKVDHRADVYALGLVLREALTGSRARQAGEKEATLALARSGELSPWPEREVPAALRAIVDRATDASPDARHADAHAMLAELDAYIVTERAANKADAPARQLAAWLGEVWGSERDDVRAADAAVESGDMVSFLDDPNLDVIGTGTERSMLATADDVVEAKPAESPAEPDEAAKPDEAKPGESVDKATRSLRARRDAPTAPPVASVGAADSPRETAIAASSPQLEARQKRGIALAMVGLAVVGIAAIVAREYVERVHENRFAFDPDDDDDPDIATKQAGHDEAPPDEDDSTGSVDDGSGGSATDGSATNGSATNGSGSARGSNITAGSGSNVRNADKQNAGSGARGADKQAGSGLVRNSDKQPGSGSSVHTVDKQGAGSGSAAAIAPKITRKVTVNSTPWSYFTVDGDPTSHQTVETIELTPGTHVIHFSNPQLHVEKGATVEVPADHDIRFSQALQAN